MHVFASLLGLTLMLIDATQAAVQTLSVWNGERYGKWGDPQYCGHGSYAVGYNMKIEKKQGSGDDTSLNGIEIICKYPDGRSGGSARSSVGPWGKWVGATHCSNQDYLTSFKLQVEAWKSNNDDTSANYIMFKCRDFAGSNPSYERFKGTGSGFWGEYRSWSDECARNSAICGIRTKVEKPQGGNKDDTALNDVQFYCCS